MSDMRARTRALPGILAAYGTTRREPQKIVLTLCEAGYTLTVLQILAEYLVEDSMRLGVIPPNTGMLSRQLQEITRERSLKAAEAYHMKGGILTAKGFATVPALATAMVAYWEKNFAAPVPVSRKVAKIAPEEAAARLTVATQEAKRFFESCMKRGIVQLDQNCYSIHEMALEPLLVGIVRAAIKAYDSPNETIHEAAHGEKTS